MPFHLHLSNTAQDRRPGAQKEEVAAEVANLIAFSRGVVIGFLGAFFVFDWALLGGASFNSLLRGAQHMAIAALQGW